MKYPQPESNGHLAQLIFTREIIHLESLQDIFDCSMEEFFQNLDIDESQYSLQSTPTVKEIISTEGFDYKLKTFMIYKLGGGYYIQHTTPTIYHRRVGKHDDLKYGTHFVPPKSSTELYVVACKKRCSLQCGDIYSAVITKYKQS